MTRCYGTIKRFWRRNDVSDIRANLAAAVSPDAASFLSPPRLSAGEIINTSSSIIVSPGVLTRYTSGSSVSKDWLICGASAARLISVKACSYLQKEKPPPISSRVEPSLGADKILQRCWFRNPSLSAAVCLPGLSNTQAAASILSIALVSSRCVFFFNYHLITSNCILFSLRSTL